jgi:hypothetical protein
MNTLEEAVSESTQKGTLVRIKVPDMDATMYKIFKMAEDYTMSDGPRGSLNVHGLALDGSEFRLNIRQK